MRVLNEAPHVRAHSNELPWVIQERLRLLFGEDAPDFFQHFAALRAIEEPNAPVDELVDARIAESDCGLVMARLCH